MEQRVILKHLGCYPSIVPEWKIGNEKWNQIRVHIPIFPYHSNYGETLCVLGNADYYAFIIQTNLFLLVTIDKGGWVREGLD